MAHRTHFCGTDTPFSQDERFVVRGNLFSFPLVLSAIAIGRHPGVSGSATAVLVVPRRTLVRIFGPLLFPAVSGGRTPMWNDPEIAAANPGVPLPSERIRVVVRADASGTVEALKVALKKIAASVGVAWTETSEESVWPIGLQDQVRVTGSSAVVAAVKSVPFSIAALSQSVLEAGGVPLMALTNAKSDAPLVLTQAAVATAAAKSTYNLSTLDVSSADTDPDGTGWPLVSASYVAMPLAFTTTPRSADSDAAALATSTLVLRDCSVPKSLAQFFSWGFTNELATQATLALGSPPPFEVVRRILVGLNAGLMCDGAQASGGTGYALLPGGFAAEVGVRKAVSAFTALQSHHLVGIYRNEGSSTTLALLRSSDADVGMMELPMDPAELARLGLSQFPLLRVPLAIVVNLPEVTGIVPLKLSVEALTEIFAGRVTRWSHPLILRDNRESIGAINVTATILPIVRIDASGTTKTLVEVLAADAARRGVTFPPGVSDRPSWPATFNRRARAADMAAAVKATPYSIGFLPVAAAIEAGARMAWLMNAATNTVALDPSDHETSADWPVTATVFTAFKTSVNVSATPYISHENLCATLGWSLDALVYLATSARETLKAAYAELAPDAKLAPFLEAIHAVECRGQPLALRTALCPISGGRRCGGKGRCTAAGAGNTVSCACDPNYSGAGCEVYTNPPLFTRSPVSMAVGIAVGIAAALAVVVVTLCVTRKKTDVWMIPRKDFSIEQLLARGGFSAVFRGSWRSTEVAIKAMPMKAIETFDPFLCLTDTDPLYEVWTREREEENNNNSQAL
jgi:ABC-type phosphate transport system substrate-binding protein